MLVMPRRWEQNLYERLDTALKLHDVYSREKAAKKELACVS